MFFAYFSKMCNLCNQKTLMGVSGKPQIFPYSQMDRLFQMDHSAISPSLMVLLKCDFFVNPSSLSNICLEQPKVEIDPVHIPTPCEKFSFWCFLPKKGWEGRQSDWNSPQCSCLDALCANHYLGPNHSHHPLSVLGSKSKKKRKVCSC